MNVLIACEESQEVCKAFRKKGHRAFSCDIIDCSGGKPEYHIKTNVLSLLKEDFFIKTSDGLTHYIEKWDLLIAHPPCTYLSNAGARHLYPRGVLNLDRKLKGDKAKDFFMKLYNSKIKKICVENPIPSKIFNLPRYSQIIQPFEHGHPFSKKTCLWLKNLPLIKPTNIIKNYKSTREDGWFNKGGVERSKLRSKTFRGIAEAMADQWGCK